MKIELTLENFCQIVGTNIEGPYKAPIGINIVGNGGIGFRAETPGLV